MDGFGVQLRESAAAVDAGDATFWGLWGSHAWGDGGSVQLFWIHDRDGDDPETRRNTWGLYQEGGLGPVAATIEAAWQTGTARGDRLRNSYLLAGDVRLPLARERGSVALGYDRYSGAADPGDGVTEAFSDLFGRNHRFLGFADLFNEIPQDTRGRGLQDFRARLEWDLPFEGAVGLTLHHFRLADADRLDSGGLADEVDLTLFWPGLVDGAFAVLGGVSWAGLSEVGETLNLAPGDVWFGYLMVRAAVVGTR